MATTLRPFEHILRSAEADIARPDCNTDNRDMIDHVSVPVRDLAKAIAFYDAAFVPLGLSRLVTREGTAGFGKRYPEFWLNLRDATPTISDPGAHVALRGPNEQMVHEFYKAALAHGAVDDGPPGPRQGELTVYVGAFVRDLDGNKIEIVTFPPSDR
jgi:catechol 2,3-dioxygenase-like lactoylglutathione lyase family enzyme